MILENFEASYDMVPLMAEINVAPRKQICQKIGSERVKVEFVGFNMWIVLISNRMQILKIR